MSSVSTHPDYDKRKPQWDMLRDSSEGEEAIKEAGVKYLPPTPGQVLDGMDPNGGACNTRSLGYASYCNYKKRAVYPDFFREGVKTLIGILNDKPAKLTLPKGMEYILDDATYNHESVQTLLRSMHEELLTTGRLGLFGDMPKDVSILDPRHYIAMYKAEAVLNWDDGSFNGGLDKLNMVVLDESGFKRDSDYGWTNEQKYRILSLGEVSEEAPLGSYRFAVVEGTDLDGAVFRTPIFKGDEADEIPFVFVNPNDLTAKPAEPPLIGLARMCLTIYRGEADYRYTLFMQGQETLVVVGGLRSSGAPEPNGEDQALRVGADARIDVEMGGDAKYIGVGSSGLGEQRTALESDRLLAATRTGQLLAPGKMSMESGEALKTRVAAQTATLTSIAISSAIGVQTLLRKIAKWRGLDETEVTVIPNLDFTNYEIAAQDLVQMITAKKLGFPLSFRTLHETAKARGVTRNSFEEELEAIKNDPKELTERMVAEEEAMGNNPQAQAGGPQKSTQGKKPQTNKPAK